MRVLITGGSGLLGKSLIETAPKDYEIESTWYTNHVGVPMYQLDICNKSQVHYLINRIQPEVVIHCAAIGSVDYAERNYSVTHLVNVNGTKNLLQACKLHRARFVFISTNAVFAGDSPPYSEDSEREPINRYGSIKRQAENLVTDSLHWTIIRPFLLYGWPWENGRENWATIAIKRFAKLEKLRIVDDRFFQPTYAPDCARAIWDIVASGEDEKVWHVSSGETMSLFDFVREVASVYGHPKSLVEPVTSDAFKLSAPRPIDTSYDLSRLESAGIEKPRRVRAGLEVMKGIA